MNKLWIIAGHGGGDPGASGGGYDEETLNRLICQNIKDLDPDRVVYLDPEIDHYQAHTLGSLTIPKDDCVLEIHMDAFGDPSAKGGHVIINSRFNPDKWDKNLADMITAVLPGRSQALVKRGDLYNANVCGNRGINYRLLECGFITNEHDRNYIINNTANFAASILSCFDIFKPEPVIPPAPKEEKTITIKIFIDDKGKWEIGDVEVK